MYLVAVVFGLLTISQLTEQQRWSCSSEIDRGYTCSNSEPSLRFYYDTTMAVCLPFFYKGCGGNGNNFMTPSSCTSKCTIMDLNRCSAGAKPTGSCDNEGLKCKAGSVCHMGAFDFGICCDSELEAIVENEWNPTCAEGEVVIKTHTSAGWQPFIGRRCEHEFCPEGSVCVQGRYLAHCCGPIVRFRNEKAQLYFS